MANKKSKADKRKKKLKTRKKQQHIFQTNNVKVDRYSMEKKIPNKEQRREYIHALYTDLDEKINDPNYKPVV